MAELYISDFLTSLWGGKRIDRRFYSRELPYHTEKDSGIITVTPSFIRRCGESAIPIKKGEDIKKICAFLTFLVNKDSHWKSTDITSSFCESMKNCLQDMENPDHDESLLALYNRVLELIQKTKDSDSKFILPVCERIVYKALNQRSLSEDTISEILKNSITVFYNANVKESELDELANIIRYNGLFTVTGLGRLFVAAKGGNDLAAISLGNYFLYNHHYQQAYDMFSCRFYEGEENNLEANATLNTSVADFVLNYGRYTSQFGSAGVVDSLEVKNENELLGLANHHIDLGIKKGSSIAKNMMYNCYRQGKRSEAATMKHLPKDGEEKIELRLLHLLESLEQSEYPYIYNNLFAHYRNLKGKENARKALTYITKSAELGNYYGQQKAAEYILSGKAHPAKQEDYDKALEYLCNAVYCSHIHKDYYSWILLHQYFYQRSSLNDPGYKMANDAKYNLKHQTTFSYCIYGEHFETRYYLLDLKQDDGKDILFLREAIAYMTPSTDSNSSYQKAVSYLQALLQTSGRIVSIEKQEGQFLNQKEYGTYRIELSHPYEGFSNITLTQEIISNVSVGDTISLILPPGITGPHLIDYSQNHLYSN